MNLKRKQIEQLILLISIFCSCSSNPSTENASTADKPFSAFFASKSSIVKLGDTLSIKTTGIVDTDSVSVSFSFNKKTVKVLRKDLQFESKDFPVGYHSVKISSPSLEKRSLSFTVLPKEAPQKREFTIVNKFPHSINSYTQGLIFHDGYLYESSGLRGKSKIYKATVSTGEALKTERLDNQYFGEGLEVIGDKLYQLTWQSKKGFVYDINTFEKLDEFSYSTEGWGLCFDGKNLIMSDGSQFLYTIDTASMKVIDQKPVFDNFGPVQQLNELEWVDGYIYANIYMTDIIVKINARTGVVEEKLYCSNLLEAKDKHATLDVLNGIAYNNETGNFYITGKNWPLLFEIQLN